MQTIRVNPVNKSVLRYKDLVYKAVSSFDTRNKDITDDIIQYGWLWILRAIKKYGANKDFSVVGFARKYLRIFLYRQLEKIVRPYMAIDDNNIDRLMCVSDDCRNIEILDRKILYEQIRSLFYSARYMMMPLHFEILEYYFGFKKLKSGISNPIAKDIAKEMNLDVPYVSQVIYKTIKRLTYDKRIIKCTH